MHFFNDILNHYSWQGAALIGVIIMLFMVQFYYYAIRYNRIPRFRLLRRKKITIDNPPISIIVVVRGENEYFLTDECMALLSQKYEHFEVVVVYVGGDLDYYAELQRIKEQSLAGNETWYAEREKRTSGYYIELCVRHFLDNSSMMEPTAEYEMTKELTNAVTLEEVNAVIPSLFRDDNKVVVSFAPEKEGAPVPTEEEILAIRKKVMETAVEAYKDDVVKEPLIADEAALKGSPVKKESKNEAYGTTEWTLKNGIKILAKLDEVTPEALTLSYEEKQTVEGKKRKQVVTVQRTYPFEEIKSTSEYLDFK